MRCCWFSCSSIDDDKDGSLSFSFRSLLFFVLVPMVSTTVGGRMYRRDNRSVNSSRKPPVFVIPTTAERERDRQRELDSKLNNYGSSPAGVYNTIQNFQIRMRLSS